MAKMQYWLVYAQVGYVCHDLAKWLSHYLIFLFISFIFLLMNA